MSQPPLHVLEWVMLFADGQPFDPAAMLQAVQDERCTSLYGVPTMFIAEPGLPAASAILRSNDLDEVTAWAQGWPENVELHRRTVMIGRWFPYSKVVDVDLPGITMDGVPRQRLA